MCIIDSLNKFWLQFFRFFCEIEGLVNIGCPVVKCREQESLHRRIHHPVSIAADDRVLIHIITKSGF